MSESSLPHLKPLRNKGNLSCPDCLVKMTPYRCAGVIIDKCDSCQGVWFDSKEIGVFKENLDSLDWSLVKKMYKPEPLPDNAISICPRCEVSLLPHTYGYNTKVETKKCSQCKGLWLELHNVLNLMELSKIGQEISQPLKGFLGELETIGKASRRFGILGKFGRFLTQRVSYFWYHWFY